MFRVALEGPRIWQVFSWPGYSTARDEFASVGGTFRSLSLSLSSWRFDCAVHMLI